MLKENLVILRNIHGYSQEEIAEKIGADSLGFISIDGLKSACADCNLQCCTGCFSGSYPIEIGHHTKSQFE